MNILAVGCHPDDLEIGCAGTLARYAAQGHRVTMCTVANGNLGHAVILPEELRAIRLQEAERAAERVGAAQYIPLDVGDLLVDAKNPEILDKMIDIIRRVQPDLIITHGPQDYMADHVHTGALVFDASFSASVPHKFTGCPDTAGVTPIYYMDTLAGVNFLPTEYVDITDTIEIKLQALACHESQIKWMLEHDKIDFLDFVRTCSKYRGLQCGATYAEGFTACPTWPRMHTRRLLP